MSVVIKLLHESRYEDCKYMMIWCDNSSGQNKNWTLYSNVVYHLFQSETTLEILTFKYFEKGHTFTLAGSYHHQVEDRIRRKKHLYDSTTLWRQKISSISKVTKVK